MIKQLMAPKNWKQGGCIFPRLRIRKGFCPPLSPFPIGWLGLRSRITMGGRESILFLIFNSPKADWVLGIRLTTITPAFQFVLSSFVPFYMTLNVSFNSFNNLIGNFDVPFCFGFAHFYFVIVITNFSVFP